MLIGLPIFGFVSAVDDHISEIMAAFALHLETIPAISHSKMKQEIDRKFHKGIECLDSKKSLEDQT